MLCSSNHKNSCVPFIASMFLGIPVASLDPALSILDITCLLKQVQPKIIFVVSKALGLIEDSLEELGGKRVCTFEFKKYIKCVKILVSL